MSVTGDIRESYFAPRRVMARQLASGAGEERALAFVLIACILFFVAGLPALSRTAHIDEDGPGLTALASGRFLGGVLIGPLLLYAVAALSHIVAKLFGGRGSWFGARLALFWSLMVVTPLALLVGLIAGFIGPGPQLTGATVIAGIVFLVIWLFNLQVAERGVPDAV